MRRARRDGCRRIEVSQRFRGEYAKTHVSAIHEAIYAYPRARVPGLCAQPTAIYTNCDSTTVRFSQPVCTRSAQPSEEILSFVVRLLLRNRRFEKAEIDQAIGDELHSKRNEKQSHEPHENANSRLAHVASHAVGTRQNEECSDR